MALPEKQIKFHEITKVNNPRIDLCKKEINRPIIFKGYKTEKDRIVHLSLIFFLSLQKDTIKNNRYLYLLEEPPTTLARSQSKIPIQTKTLVAFTCPAKSTESEKLVKMMNNDLLIQPQMRFTARTDLERVFDSLSGKYWRQDEKNILIRQLEYLDLYSSKKPSELLKTGENGEEEGQKEEEKKTLIPEQKDTKPSSSNEEKQNKLLYKCMEKKWKKKNNINVEAQGMLRDLHMKTHFKAAQEVAEKKSK